MSLSHFQLKTAINRATSRSDWSTIRDALEVSSDMYKKDNSNVPDYVQRHLVSLSIWEEIRYALHVIISTWFYHQKFILCWS
jgi:hypothetical protein